MSYDPFTIANYIITKLKDRDKDISVMQILKLQYIAHGYTLALLNKPLFDAKIKAWTYGPVVNELYFKLKEQGDNIAKIGFNNDETIDTDRKNIIDRVLKIYDGKTAWQLSDLTHEPFSPWSEAICKSGFYTIIQNKDIKKYYENLINP